MPCSLPSSLAGLLTSVAASAEDPRVTLRTSQREVKESLAPRSSQGRRNHRGHQMLARREREDGSTQTGQGKSVTKRKPTPCTLEMGAVLHSHPYPPSVHPTAHPSSHLLAPPACACCFLAPAVAGPACRGAGTPLPLHRQVLRFLKLPQHGLGSPLRRASASLSFSAVCSTTQEERHTQAHGTFLLCFVHKTNAQRCSCSSASQPLR